MKSGKFTLGILFSAISLVAIIATYQNCGSTTGNPFNVGSNNSSSIGTINNTVQISGKVTGGSSHSCAINPANAIKCWGAGSSGQLGYGGSASQSPVAVPVFPAVPGIPVKVTAGDNFTCALLTSGAVYCWGDDSAGQLGNGSTSPALSPVLASVFNQKIVDIAATAYTICAVTQSGSILCVGDNGGGELGNSSPTTSKSAVAVSGITNAVQITGRFEHFCAVLITGQVMCWGGGANLVNGNTSSFTPVLVVGYTGFATKVSAGPYDDCLISNNSVSCWGDNSYGQLGNSSSAPTVQLVGVTNSSAMTDIAVGEYTNCGLTSSGSVMCWGYGEDGELGNGAVNNGVTTNDFNYPVAVKNISTAVALGSGYTHKCALLSGGTVQCWGANGSGQLGNNSTTASDVPVQVQGF